MTKRNILVFALIAFICAFVLIYVPKWQLLDEGITDPKERIELENKLRMTLSQTLGGLFILVGLYFAWRRIAATERAVEVSQQGQITERFTRATDQLGATNERGEKKLEIRLGGIYALERIARDSKDDHRQVMEVLTAYVRENAPLKPKANHGEENGEAKEEEANKSPQPTDIQKVPADIQAILTVLGRRSLTYQQGEDHRLDLRGTDLQRADLRDADLWGADLWGADLQRANLRGAFLWGAFLGGAFLGGANLRITNLQRADLRGANLRGANLEGANLRITNLQRADLRGANLLITNLEGAYLGKANLEGARNLTIEQLSNVTTLYEAKLDPELEELIKKDYPHLLEEPVD